MIRNKRPIEVEKRIELSRDSQLDGMVAEYTTLLVEERIIKTKKKGLISAIEKLVNLKKDEMIFTESHMIFLVRDSKKTSPVKYRIALKQRKDLKKRPKK